MTYSTLEVLTLCRLVISDIETTGKKTLRLLEFIQELRVSKKVPKDVSDAVLVPIGRAEDPLEELERRADTWTLLAETIDEFKAIGKNGLILHNQCLYPVTIDLDDKLDQPWLVENEQRLMRDLAKSFIAAEGVPEFDGEIMLFADYGFSESMRRVMYTPPGPVQQASLASLFGGKGLKRKGAR